MPDAPPLSPEVPVARDAASPGTAESRSVRSIFRGPDGAVSTALTPDAMAAAIAGGTGTLWVDLDSQSAEHHALLTEVFHLHPLHIEDVGNPQSRVKVEELPHHYAIVVARVVKFCEETADPYDVETSNLNVIVGPNWVISAHAGESPSVAQAAEVVRKNPDLLARGAARIAHMMLDAAVDAFFPLLDDIGGFVDEIEERVFVQCDTEALRPIFALKRLVLSLRRYLSPQREVFGILSNRPSEFIAPEVQVYFRDVYDHVLRINDELDNYRELLSGVLDGFLSQVNNRLGQVTKSLSVVATLSLPFVVVSGMWGMNVTNIPFSKHEHGFVFMALLQLALGIGLVVALRRRRLL